MYITNNEIECYVSNRTQFKLYLHLHSVIKLLHDSALLSSNLIKVKREYKFDRHRTVNRPIHVVHTKLLKIC